MTMILSTRREPCAILAAERQWGNASSPPSYERKLVLHSLPLGFGLAGFVWVPIGGIWATTMKHVEDFAAGIKSTDELIVSDIADRLRTLFQPAMDAVANTMQIFIAVVKDGKAAVGIQEISARIIAARPTRFIDGCEQLIPELLLPYYDQQEFQDLLDDPDITDEKQIGRNARFAIERCIEHERSLHPDGKNEVTGGDVDVAIITTAGASFLSSGP